MTCIRAMDHQDCAIADDNNLQFRVRQKLLLSNTKEKEITDRTAEKDSGASEREKHTLNLKDHSIEDSLQARIREKWTAKQRFASTPLSSDDLSESDNITIHGNNGSCLSQENGLHPTQSSSDAKQRGMLSMTASDSLDARLKDQFLPLDTDNSDTGRQSPLANENAAEKSSLQISDVPRAPEPTPYLDCRPKVKQVNAKTSTKASPEFKDDFECEVFREGEESERGRLKTCKKHPGHHEFIPVNDFTLKHLPQAYRSEVFLKGIKSVAKVTVLLRVKYNSTNRPRGYMFSNLGGTRLAHIGSGFVYSRLLPDNISSVEVPDSLIDSGREDRGLPGHLEAKYDEKADEERVRYILEMLLKSLGEEEEASEIIHELTEPLSKVVTGMKDYMYFLFDNFRNYSSPDDVDDELMVSARLNSDFGELSMDSLETQSVFGVNPRQDVIDIFKEKGKSHGYFRALPWFLLHSFRSQQPANNCEREYRRLRSMKNREKLVDKFFSFYETIFGHKHHDKTCLVKLHELHDKDNINDSDIETDEDVEDAATKCKQKNNENAQGCENDWVEREGQRNFPDQLDEHVEEVAEESLRETFSIISPCSCPPCKSSKNPEPKGYCVNVLTARHVVFDKEEAANTEVVLFYDDKSGSGEEKLYGVDVRLYSDAGDLAILMCATHDVKLIKKLRLLVVDITENIETMKSESDTPLAVICSHPHGNFKHVTVGEWIQRDIYHRRDGQPPLWTSYLYNTPTCAGSSGAPVVILGHKEGTLLLDSMPHPHHGRHNQKLNKSSRLISFDKELEDISPNSRARLWKEQNQIRSKIRGEMAAIFEKEAKILTAMRSPLDKMKDKLKDAYKIWEELNRDELSDKYVDILVDVLAPSCKLCERVTSLREPLGKVSKKMLLKMLDL